MCRQTHGPCATRPIANAVACKLLRGLRAAVVIVLLAGCGGAGAEQGTATMWVTRDRGASVLLDTEVPAGQTLMRALASKVGVKTRYGGRYLQAVNGIEGSLDRRRDW